MSTQIHSSVASVRTQASSTPAWWPLVARLHFYVGLFIGPFILLAALTGTLFVLTPQLENYLYADQLRTPSIGVAQPLSRQVEAATARIGEGPRLFAVRPAVEPGYTTRVMFTEPGMANSESRSLFVDPVTLDIRGDMMVYGTSGNLPFRTWLDYLHRNALLGEVGRNYSELAASWLWIATLGGLVLWFAKHRRQSTVGAARSSSRLRLQRWHGLTGMWIAIGLLFLSATGLTWSNWAGDRIGDLRKSMGWVTPAVSVELNRPATMPMPDEHAEHRGHTGQTDQPGTTISTEHAGHAGHAGHGATMMPNEATLHPKSPTPTSASAPAPDRMALPAIVAQFDPILSRAHQVGIDSNQIEIRPPRTATQAWTVRETDRTWPTQVDAVAIDPTSLEVTSRADFASFPLIAKLIRWGIDMHMGILFGWANQLLMAAFGIALSIMVVLGYSMWWKRRPAAGSPTQTMTSSWLRLSWPARALVIALAIAVGWSLPLMGASLLAFVLIDAWRWHRQHHRRTSKRHPA